MVIADTHVKEVHDLSMYVIMSAYWNFMSSCFLYFHAFLVNIQTGKILTMTMSSFELPKFSRMAISLGRGAKFIGKYGGQDDKGARTFFAKKKMTGQGLFFANKMTGRRLFFTKKMTGRELFFRKKMTGQELFFS